MEFTKVLSYYTDDGKKYFVVFENGGEEYFSDEEFFEYGLYETEQPLNIDHEMLMRKVHIKRGYMSSVSFLRGSLKPSRAVKDRLRQEGMSDEIIMDVLARLEEEGYLDDRKFCIKHIKKRVDAGNCSRMYIIAELREKGIGEELAAECLQELDVDDESLAENILIKKRKGGYSDEKIKRYLAGKGFSVCTIISVFENHSSDGEEEQDIF
jgi:SOS response regulatory protein OraA/RecX